MTPLTRLVQISNLILSLMLGANIIFGSISWAKGHKTEPVLTIKTPNKTISFKSISDLLERKNLTTLEVESDPAYEGRKMTYQAVPFYSLFEDQGGSQMQLQGAVIQYRCLDGFSAAISKERLLNSSPDKSIAYLAIEPVKKWPKMPGKEVTPGPFYLIWSNPNASHINREEWPNQIYEFEIKKSLKESYPNIFPASEMSENSSVGKGFKVFTQVCFNCHTMNLQGEGNVGPDLNLPMNPTEYYKEGVLQTFVRNPKSVRDWPGSLMPAFPVDVVSDADLENLVEYLRHMSKRKVNDQSKALR